MEKILTVSEASRGFVDIINRTYYRGETTVLTRSGEVVAKIVPVARDTVLGSELAKDWKEMPHLSKTEADSFAKDIESAREAMPALRDPWES